MNITQQIIIERNPEIMWKIVAEEFDQAHKWMGFVTHSYQLKDSAPITNAPMFGRVCEFTDKADGLKAKEEILSYSKDRMEIIFDVVPLNTPLIFPVRKNIVTMIVSPVGKNSAQITWNANVTLTSFGLLIFPLIKRGLSKNFAAILRDLQQYALKNVKS
ncbi:SRPBCC family protein [uncultured Shewanella sp.]|uniref:SRPBCC family protein n=1 Tax=uncultured Shewanella sp. TaxID=173975 RepID=UPI00263359D7|nr:SRPBCC family protein [uncultured Shewanella sp.]